PSVERLMCFESMCIRSTAASVSGSTPGNSASDESMNRSIESFRAVGGVIVPAPSIYLQVKSLDFKLRAEVSLRRDEGYPRPEEVRKMMPPSSWYRLEEFAQLESTRRRAAARHRDHSPVRRRRRRRRLG